MQPEGGRNRETEKETERERERERERGGGQAIKTFNSTFDKLGAKNT